MGMVGVRRILLIEQWLLSMLGRCIVLKQKGSGTRRLRKYDVVVER